EHLLDGALAADLADRRRRLVHPLEELEEVPVRAAVLVDGHPTFKAISGSYERYLRKLARKDVRTGSRGMHRRGALLPARPADGGAAPRGRDARALRRPAVARAPVPHGSRTAWRGAAPLPARVARDAHRGRVDLAPARLGAVRRGQHPDRRAPRRAARL